VEGLKLEDCGHACEIDRRVEFWNAKGKDAVVSENK
jgi:hypothetical protein